MSNQVMKINQSQVTQADLDRVVELEAELKAAKAAVKGKMFGVTLRVGDNGKTGADRRTHVEVRGISKFPVKLYKAQMLRLLDISEEIKGFIASNELELTEKK